MLAQVQGNHRAAAPDRRFDLFHRFQMVPVRAVAAGIALSEYIKRHIIDYIAEGAAGQRQLPHGLLCQNRRGIIFSDSRDMAGRRQPQPVAGAESAFSGKHFLWPAEREQLP